MSEEERDDLDGVSAEGLKLLLKHEREAHVEEVDRLREDFGKRLDSLKSKITRGQEPRPNAIHPADVKELGRLPLDDRQKILHDILAGRVTVTEDAPRGVWSQEKPRVYTREQYKRLTLDEKAKVNQEVFHGKASIRG